MSKISVETIYSLIKPCGLGPKKSKNIGTEQNSDLGTVLSRTPSTGSLQLTQAATQRLLASLGGRLTRRGDSGLIIFFPIAEAKS